MTTFNYDTTPINHTYTTTFRLDEEAVKNYLSALDMAEDSTSIPPSIFAVYHHWNATIGNPVPGTIHLKQEMQYYENPSLGDVYDVTIKIVEKYEKKAKNYLVFETLIQKDSQLYCKETTTYLWGFAAST